MLGYADLSTSQIYTQLVVTQLKAVFDKTHPIKLEQPEEEPDPTV